MIKIVRSVVQQARQQFREHLPSNIAKQFSRDITNGEWTHAFVGLANTDLASKMETHSAEDVLGMVSNPSKNKAEIRRLEGFLKTQDPKHFDLIKAKSQQLAHYMQTREPGTNLLRNAAAISGLFLESKVDPRRTMPSKDFVQAVDQLVTHYAVENLSQETKDTLASLVQSEAKGMNYVISYLTGLRRDELSKAKEGSTAYYNAYKGYAPSLQQGGVSLKIANDKQGAELLAKSYQRIGDYTGSRAENFRNSRGYYFAPVNDKAAFEQGILQNVRQTAGGVDAITGYTQGLTAADAFSLSNSDLGALMFWSTMVFPN